MISCKRAAPYEPQLLGVREGVRVQGMRLKASRRCAGVLGLIRISGRDHSTQAESGRSLRRKVCDPYNIVVYLYV